MTTNEKLEILNKIGKVEVKKDSSGWLCKHEDAMIKQGNNIIAYFMYMPSKEIAVEHYFDFVTKSDVGILMVPGFAEYQYNGNEFVKVQK